jgi:enoyl-CoA hydratase/carnithine racemase
LAYSLARDGAVGILEMNRPPANAYTAASLKELRDGVLAIRDDATIRCVVVRSLLEKFFCAGADITTLKGPTVQENAEFLTLAHEIVDMIERTPKIFIAAIAGHCLGGGLELALGCDFRFAAEGKFGIGLVEVNLGLSPGMGGTQRLARLIHPSQALHMMVTGETVPPGRALELGIVDRVWPAATFWDETLAYARRLASGPSYAHGLIKLSMKRGREGTLAEGLAYERANQTILFQSADAAEGIGAFLAKRKPDFKGR